MAALALLDGEAERITRRAVELALAGDTTALRLCLERIVPPLRDAPVTVGLPEMRSAADAVAALGAVVQAVSEGELTPSEAATLAGVIETFRRTLETEDLERRVAELEDRAR